MKNKQREKSSALPGGTRIYRSDLITIDPFLTLSFPEHSDELRRLFAALPRQGFSRDFAAVPAVIQRTTDDGEVDITWVMQMPLLSENLEAVAELFFKIENFVIRPKIKKLIQKKELFRAVEIGTMTEIAESISADEAERKIISEALVFGSNILLEIQIVRQPLIIEFGDDKVIDRKKRKIKQERLTGTENKLFRYFDVCNLDNTDTVSGKEKTRDKAAQEDQVVIIISPQYATLIDAALDVPTEGTVRTAALELPALSLRLLELIHCSELLGVPKSSKVGKDQQSIEIDLEEFSELTPLKNSNKVMKLIERIWQTPSNPENN